MNKSDLIFEGEKNVAGVCEIEGSKIENNTKFNLKINILNVIFIISSFCFSMLFRNASALGALLSILVLGAFFCWYLFVKKKQFLQKIKFDNKIVIALAILFSVYFIGIAIDFNLYYTKAQLLLLLMFSMLATFVYSYFFVKVFYDLTVKFFKGISKKELKFLLISFFIGATMAVIVNFITYLFVPVYSYSYFEPFLSFDSYTYIKDMFKGVNSIRHVLMSNLNVPFLIIPYLFSKMNFLRVCNIIFQIEQIFVICLSGVIIYRIFKQINAKTSILIALIFTSSIGIVLTAMCPDKYILPMFYALLTVYFTLKKSDYKWLFLIFATASLTTNAILALVVVFYERKSAKKAAKEIFNFVVLYVLACAIFAQLDIFLNIDYYIKDSLIYTASSSVFGEPVGVGESFVQMLIFIATLFVFPKYALKNHELIQAPASFNAFAIIGLVILVICLVGFCLNHQNKLARFSIIWLFVVFLLLSIIGFGAAKNEMFIYSSAFIFPIFTLIAMFFQKVFKNKCFLVSAILVSVIGIYNAVEFFKLIALAATHFGL